MSLEILADVAAKKSFIADDGPVLSFVVPVALTFANALSSGDSILVATSKGKQMCTVTSHVPARRPILLHVRLPSHKESIKSVCHIPQAVIVSHGWEAQKTRVNKYIRKRTLAERKRLAAQ
jgi:hypothetical protein|eukprot:6561781-Prymnesium_polylepis.2